METCEVCGLECKSLHGLKIHTRKAHARDAKTAPVMSRLGELVVAAMSPHLDSSTGERLVTFLTKLDVWPPDAHVVISPSDGPWLVTTTTVGSVVRSTRGPCVVYPLSVAMDALQRDRWHHEAEANRSRRRRKETV